MSDQAENKIETTFEEDADGKVVPQTQEDKFFGVQTEIANKEVKESKDVAVEIVDDTPEEDRRPAKKQNKEQKVDNEEVDKEISEYSKRAADRINQIKYEFHEERRAKEAAQRESTEAVKRLQTILSENKRLQTIVDEGGKVLNQQALNNAQFAKLNAQEKYKKAYDEGNSDEMAKAQEELSKAVLAEQQAPGYAQAIQQQIPEAQTEQKLPEPDPALNAWAQKNPWFMSNDPNHQQMTSYSLYLDKKLKSENIDPVRDSEKFYAEIDKGMREEFPSFFGVSQQNIQENEVVQTEEKRQPANVVAPATRDSGNNNPRNVVLTKTQVKLARQLGITPEQYAKQLLKG
jgi:hypothetical protein